MKKTVALILSVLLLASLTVSALAAGGFVSSPGGQSLGTVTITGGGNGATIEEVTTDPTTGVTTAKITVSKNGDVECDDELVVAPYSARASIASYDSRVSIDYAATEITDVGEGNLDKLGDAVFAAALRSAAANANTTVEYLAVSDLFDVTYYEDHEQKNDSDHEEPYHYNRVYTIGVGEDTLARFVALLHRKNGTNGAWSVIPNVTVDRVNGTISFAINVDDLSPFAIVVKKSGGGSGSDSIGGVVAPRTADPVSLVGYGAAFLTGAGGLTLLRKRKNH